LIIDILSFTHQPLQKNKVPGFGRALRELANLQGWDKPRLDSMNHTGQALVERPPQAGKKAWA